MAPVKKCRRIIERLHILVVIGLVVATPTSLNAGIVGGVNASTLGVIVNLDDPQSVAVGDYYQKRRRIPQANIIRIRFRTDVNTLSESEFRLIKVAIDRQTPVAVQAYALTWLRPYRVDCMSITTAVAMGYNREFCSAGCNATRSSRYFDSDSIEPMLDLGVRPAMLLAATSQQQAQALIDRGVGSDGTAPKGTAYLVTTDDAARSVRTPSFALAQSVLGDAINIKRVDGHVQRATDVMFYFTGAVTIPDLNSNRFLPRAVGDHLTSTGGALLDTDQMSSLRWLEAGTTGSYGTVTEPCNFTAKFPDPLIMMKHYLLGETLIEAYWKSVAMPGQGLFIGEPLARPYATRAR